MVFPYYLFLITDKIIISGNSARAAWLLLLSVVTKVNKNTLSSTLLRDHKIVVQMSKTDFFKFHFLLTSSTIVRLVLIDNFKALLLRVTVAE